MKERKGTIYSLQGLRGIAILLIFISHYPFLRNTSGGNAFVWAGALGVELFILLSGYLTARQNSTSVPHLGQSLKRKIGRFYPLHILTLVCALPFAFDLLFVDWHFNTWIKLCINALLLHSWVPIGNVYFSFNSVSWYLSTTVFFIVAAPLALKYIARLSIKKWLCVVWAVVFFQFLWCVLLAGISVAHWAIYIFPAIRFLDFILGCGVYYISQELSKKTRLHNGAKVSCLMLIAIASSIIFLIFSVESQSEFFSVCVWTLPCALLLLVLTLVHECQLSVFRYAFENRFFVFVGNISFEFFLLHQLVIRYGTVLTGKMGLQENVWSGFAYLLASIIASWVTQWLLNLPKRTKEEKV